MLFYLVLIGDTFELITIFLNFIKIFENFLKFYKFVAVFKIKSIKKNTLFKNITVQIHSHRMAKSG